MEFELNIYTFQIKHTFKGPLKVENKQSYNSVTLIKINDLKYSTQELQNRKPLF